MFPPETKILVVDDMIAMRKLIVKSLNGIGFKSIEEAGDGKAGWKKILSAAKETKPYQLIISDWNMPEMGGIELLKEVRNNPDTIDVPFVILTAEFDREQVEEAVKSGISAYITKPFSMAVLSEKLHKVWEFMVSRGIEK